MPVTIRDIAREAGVSTAAVSKVLHGSGKSVRVSEERAEAIREIAGRLRYRPNAIARNLRAQRTHAIGVLFENFGSFTDGPLYYLQLLEGIGRVAFQQHYRMTLLPEVDTADIAGALGDGQLEGVIWCKMAQTATTERIARECPIPIVALNAPVSDGKPRTISVNCDNGRGIELLVEHLWDLGHRHFAFVREEQETDTPDQMERHAAFESALQARDVSLSSRLTATLDWTLDGFADWYAENSHVTAIVGWSERTAGRVLQRARESGREVPRDLSVVGFDSTAYCESTSPRLTAARQPILEMAEHATKTLLQLIQGHSVTQTSHIFPCTLDVRDSTASPLTGEMEP